MHHREPNMSFSSAKLREERVMIFFDVRNIVKSCTVNGHLFRVDLSRMVNTLAWPRTIVGAYAFDGEAGNNDGTVEQYSQFHHMLRVLGFRVVVRRSPNMVYDGQKEVDVALACKMLMHAVRDNYDVAILISGDRDFVPAVEEVQELGKRVLVASFRETMSDGLRLMADESVILNSVPMLILNDGGDGIAKEKEPAAEAEEPAAAIGQEPEAEEGPWSAAEPEWSVEITDPSVVEAEEDSEWIDLEQGTWRPGVPEDSGESTGADTAAEAEEAPDGEADGDAEEETE